MALTNIAGVGGGISFVSGFNGRFRGFDYDFSMPVEDITGFPDGGARVLVAAGGNGVTGSVNGVLQFDASNTQPIPDAVATGSAVTSHSAQTGAMTLTFTTGCTLAFTAFVTSWSGTRNETGAASTTWRYESSGQTTIVWDETP